MKRTLVALTALIAVFVGAVQPPALAPLPNFDRRTDHAPTALAPQYAEAAAALEARVPQLQITSSKVLNGPNFFSSRDGFLTGPNAEGGAVQAITARAFSNDDPHRAVKAFLNEHAGLIGYGADALSGAEVRRDYVTAHNGLRTVIWQQKLENIPVFEALTMGHITKHGELVNLYTEFVADANLAAARGLKGRAVAAAAGSTRLSAVDALILAAQSIGDEVTSAALTSRGAAQGAARKEVFSGSGTLKGDQYAELVWLPLNANTLRLCWQAIVVSKTRGEGFLCIVDAETGEVVLRRSLTHYISPATYNVYVSDSPSPFSPGHLNPSTVQPPLVNRQLVVTPALNTNASPNGWINDGVNETTGNNVDAHTDRNDDDLPDLPRPQGNPNRVFDFPLDLTMAPTTYSAAATVQLFYWNNFTHDKLWELGFTEAAGNFQVNNFGRGGLGNDAVSADAQDGGGFNNANMLTPPDGIPPRMQMYLFDGPTPDRDGDLDAEVILHEYTHGLSNRRVGGGVGIFQLQSAGMGEGWSDFYGLGLLAEPADAIDGNWAVGGYLTFDIIPNFRENYYYGIRRYPYTTNLLKNPLTFKDIDPTQASPHTGILRNPIFGPFTPFDASEVHNQGEVWCVTLWEVRANLIAKYGWTNGNQAALQLVTDAMSLCPVNPNFVQSRDAILLADRVNNNSANYNELWTAFAKRGLGAGATSPDSSTTQGVRESYDFPGLSLVSAFAVDGSTGNGNGVVDPNECVEVFVNLRNNSVSTAFSVSGVLTSTTPGVTVVQPNSAYPNLAVNAAGQNITPFRIYTSPSFVCGTRIQLALVATGSGQQATTNAFVLRSGFVSLNPVLLNNNTPVSIPDANTNGVQSTINVSGMSGALGKLTVSLHILHPAVGDLVIELISPDGTTIALAKNQGAAGDNYGTACSPFSSRTTFDDNAQFPISVANPPYVGTFRPDEPLDVFEGKFAAAVNGPWRLRVIDTGANDVGSLQCWTLALYPTVCTDGGGPCAADLALSATATPAPALIAQDLTYTLTVANSRPIDGTAVTLTNVLPANVTFVSATSPDGACVFSGGTVRCTFGTLTNGETATATIIVRPTALGSLTNVFSVGGSTPDANPANNVATVISSVNVPAPLLVADGALLVGDASGGIEAGETVTLNLALRNTGSAATTNLVATLLDGNGVSGASGSQNYGAIAIGASAARPFTFTAPGNAGETVSAVLQLQDGVLNLGTVTFHFTLGGDLTFANGAEIIINNLGTASPYPATIDVNGVAGVIGQARVTFTKLSHTFPDDIDALLVGPLGQKLVLMSDAGGGTPIVNRTLTFTPSASGPLPNESAIAAGNYLPSDYASGTEPVGDIFPAPAPSGSPVASLSSFNGTVPNGTWALFIHDDAGNDGGSVSGGWSLGLSIVVPVLPLANLSITASAAPVPAVVGEPLTYTLTIANSGPSNATVVVLTNVLPAGATFVSALSSQGTATNSAGLVTANLGSLNSGSSATVTITVTPTSAGSKSNVASVTGDVTDPEPGNNSVTTVVTANNPVADLAISASATPSTVFVSSNVTFQIVVTNRGPNHADSVRVTNRLAASMNFVSATNSQGACSFSGGVVTCDFGSLAANASATATIVATPFNAGGAANLFAVVAASTDSVPANNTTNVITTVNALAPLIVSSGAALTSESVAPANGAIESGEVVTINFGLRNVGTLDVGNLVATLLATGGVTGPGAAQNYGALVANGPTVSRSFSFTATAAAGGTLTATLQLQDGAQNLGTVAFTFNVSASRSFTNSEVIIIPLAGAATNYPATITVSGVTGTVSKVTVSLRQFTHTFPEDVDVLLVGPAGQKVMLMSDAGAGNSVSGVTLTFDSTGGALPFASAISGGTYRPTDYPPGDILPAPAPAGPFGTNLSAFNSVNPNGTWSLYVFDDANGDAGRIDGGWTLNIQTATPIVPSADVAVTATAPASIISGSPVSYAITVANYGPATATGVTLTDTLPAGFTLSSVSVSQGSYTTSAGLVTANLGALASGGTATVTINGTGTANLTNQLAVVAAQSDANLANNSVSLVTVLIAPTLRIRATGANVVIAWPTPSTGYVLESSSSVLGPWAAAGLTITVVGGENRVTAPATGTVFYRLRKL